MMRSFIVVAMMLSLFSVVFADDDHEREDILVRLAAGVSVDAINARYGTRTEDVLLNGSVYRLKVKDEDKLDATVAAMKRDPDILEVGLNYFAETPEAVRRTIAVIDRFPDLSKFHDQDAYNRIRAPQAHSIATGAGVIVAVIDTGVDYRHPELASHILRDSNNRIAGYDFVQNDRDPMDSTNGIDDDKDGITDEGAGHGTHVAGIIRLVAPSAKILPLRVLNSDGIGTADSVARAIDYAVEYQHESKNPLIINLSLGFPTPSFVVQDAIDEAIEEGIPVIASAGNDNSSTHYPAAFEHVISVTAVGPNGVKAVFANYGRVDLSAPGIGIYSTYLKNQYAWWTGTSMSAPFVSGEAALVMSIQSIRKSDDDPGDDDPHDSGVNILPILKNGVDSIYEVNPRFAKGMQLGAGVIDVFGALAQMRGADHLTVQKAVYSKAGKVLTVIVRSSKAPAARLTIVDLGPMKYNPSTGAYEFNRKVNVPASSVSVSSSEGGILTAYIANR